MCSDNSIYASFVEFAQDGLCDCSSGGRLCTATELVDEDEGACVRLAEHCLHVHEERTVCTEVVVDRLVVADADHDSVEYRKLRCFGSRDEHSPLEHILKQADSLETYRFSSGIRSGDKEYVLLRCE